MRRICRESNMSGVFGPIIELVDCDEKFFTAVEVTAGNRLSQFNTGMSISWMMYKRLSCFLTY